MLRVNRLMGNIGANEFKWSREYLQNGVAVYRETFLLPTEAHYYALKELRSSAECLPFHELSQCIDKEAGLPVQYLGLKITNEYGGLF
ncbi:hypothetical protein FIU87_05175 [Bacillus sp. THAF10]|nr:hypothetical protein FIU87_05175 [Bacillus sp. THAF10]